MLAPKTTIGDVIGQWADDAPDAPALQSRFARPASYGTIAALIDDTRAFLAERGIGSGDRIAIIISEPARAMAVYLGVMNAAVAVPMNPESTEFELENLFRELDVSGVVLSEDLSVIAGIAGKTALPVFWAEQDDSGMTGSFRLSGGTGHATARRALVKGEDIACIQTSSGTTGRAKATLQSHEVLVYRSSRDRRILELGPDDVMINFRPPYLSGPLNIGLLGALTSGGSVVVPPFFDAEQFFDDLLEFGITWYTGGPAYHRAILECAGDFPDALARHKLRFIRSAGYALPEDMQRNLEDTFGVPCIQKYGSSEAGLVSCNPLPPGQRKIGTCGPIEGCDVRVVSDKGENQPTGEVGEIWVRGQGVFSGYDDDTLTAEAFSGEWFKTGDLGALDPDGYLSIAGRKNEIINRGGQKIAPQEVEKVYTSLPGIAQVMCFPVPHSTLGTTAGLAVVPIPDAPVDPDTLRKLAADKLSRFKQPEIIVVTDKLPLGPTGKPLRKQAAALLEVTSRAEEESEDGHLPADQLEQIWSNTLGVETVYDDQNFTWVGGDSLRAMRLVLRIERAFGVSLPSEIIYGEGATLGGLRDCLEKNRGTTSARYVMPRRAELKADLPLTSSQARLWSICKTFPDVALYNSSFGLRFPAPLDLNALREALDLSLQRHEALRMIFPETAGLPRQRILPRLNIPLTITDMSDAPIEGLDTRVADTARDIAGKPFDLENGPIVRHDLLLVPDGAVFLHQMHHIVGDATSTSILAREISASYAAFRNGTEPDLIEIKRTFGDFVADQAARLTEERTEKLLDFWETELDGCDTFIELPADRPRPPALTHAGERIFLDLGDTLARSLRRLAAENGTSVFAVALAAFEILVHRMTGKEKFIIGTGVENRPPEFRQQIVGFCLNTIPFPARVRGEQTFRELVSEVHDGLLRTKAHNEVPFDAIVRRMAPDRWGAVLPLVQILFGLMPKGTRPADIANTESRLWNFDHDRARFDLTVMLDETDKGLGGFVEFATDLYKAETIRHLIERYRRLLEALVENPDAHPPDLSLVLDDERSRIEDFSQGPTTDYPRDQGIDGVFADVVHDTPDAIAVVQGDLRITYRALDNWSDAIARQLASAGIKRGDVVGLTGERTASAIAAILGILKAGGNYLVLDDKLPPIRVAQILDDAGVRLVLVQDGSALTVADGVTSLRLADATSDTQQTGPFEASPVQPYEIAYVCYTSGTTGLPKGVEIEHRSVLRLVLGADYASLGSDERICQTGSLAFDASTFEVWGALLNGATLVMPEAATPSLSELADLIEKEGVTTLWLTAGLFRQVVDSRPECFRSVRQVLTGGDVVSGDHVLKLKQIAPDCRVINGYGPTENTTFSICGELDAETLEQGLVPLGRPIANSSAYILDAAQRPVPLGVEGDLYVGGDGVARGYRGKPDLTQQAFVRDPFADHGSRMYRTGDRARFLLDGRIEFLGRKDFQIKIRGFRVELQEIEMVLRACDGIRDAVVVARTREDAAKSLHAFYVADEDAPPDATALHDKLNAHLPNYMIPATISELPVFPLNASGKIDRNALLDLCSHAVTGRDRSSRTLPETPLERLLAQIWSELLPQARDIGTDDDFFKLGGDSLLTLRLGFRIEEETGLRIPQIDLFGNSTLRRMAKRVEKALLDHDAAGAIADHWEKVVGSAPQDPAVSFFDEGGDSFLLAQLARRLSEAFGAEISMVDFFSDPSLLGAIHLVSRTLHGQNSTHPHQGTAFTPVISLVDGATDTPVATIDGMDRFFIVSGAGGHVLPFVPVARRLRNAWHGVGLLDPAFDTSHPNAKTVNDVADRLISALRKADPEGPYLLVGYSYGGHVAHEMARILCEQGLPVGVVILDSRCRSHFRNIRSAYKREKAKLKRLAKKTGLFFRTSNPMPEDQRHDEIARDEMAHRVMIADQQRQLLAFHTPRSADIPLVLIRTVTAKRREEDAYGWSRAATVIGVLKTGGNHLTLFKGEHEDQFVGVLDEALTMLRDHLRSATRKAES